METYARARAAGWTFPDRARARVHIFFIFFFGGRWRCEGVEYAPSPLVPLSRACVFSYTVRASVVLVFCFCFVLFLKSLSCALGVRSPRSSVRRHVSHQLATVRSVRWRGDREMSSATSVAVAAATSVRGGGGEARVTRGTGARARRSCRGLARADGHEHDARRGGGGGGRRAVLVSSVSSSSLGARDYRALEHEMLDGASETSSVADAVYRVGRASATMPLRDRAICSLAAQAVEVTAESCVEDASLTVSLALKRAIEANAKTATGEVKVVVGYAPTRGGGAAPHAWLEVGGKVLDVCVEGLALAEAARRAGVDYDDEEAMVAQFGEVALRDAAYAPGPRGLRPLTVLNHAVHPGGSAASERKAAYGLTLNAPPPSVKGAAEAVTKAEYFRRVVAQDDDATFLGTMPDRVRATYDAIASIRIETVDSQAARLDALQNAAAS